MGYTVNYAGTRLDKYCKVLNVYRDILPARTNFSKVIPTMHGSHYTGYQYGDRFIKLDIAIVAKSNEEYMVKVRKLANILDVANPSILEISDEPDKYNYAVLDGSTDLEKLYKTGRTQLVFLCNDPFAYSKEHKVFVPDEKGHITIVNEGTTATSPIIEVDFNSKACFFQATNYKGETVLVGLPKQIEKPTVSVSDKVIDDNCSSSSTFTTLAQSLLDDGRVAEGNFGVGVNGGAIICTNFGSTQENTWGGTAFKRNLDANVSEFEVSVDLIFSSEGANYVEPPEPPVSPPPPTPENPNPPTTNTYGTYEVYGCGGLWINEQPNTKYPIYALGPGMKVYPVEFSGNWAKHTHTNIWGNTFTGWSHTGYLRKISNSVIRSINEPMQVQEYSVQEYADDEVGLLEIYGFDKHGSKLFKIVFSDFNEFYEYVEPQVFIGSHLVLDDGKNCPAPRKVDVKDSSGKVTGSKEMATGVFGDYNDFFGNVTIRREKNSAGQFLWSASINKVEHGKIIRNMSTTNAISNSSYPTGDLNYLGFYIGKYGNKRNVDLMAINNISVKRLNFKTDQSITDNMTIFNEGDHLQIDFNSGLISLNQRPFLTHTDIGSEFFEIPTGESQFAIKTDDAKAVTLCGIQERFV